MSLSESSSLTNLTQSSATSRFSLDSFISDDEGQMDVVPGYLHFEFQGDNLDDNRFSPISVAEIE